MSSPKIPNAAQIRQSFLDFFKEKQHTIVPSDNVGYTSRDGARIFTNAGMNQFVPIFLGERSADVDTWPGVLHKGLPTRAADTQKCIRAGGKHNDLEDVGLDTYHHTFFEMLGNWSFGDYFKKEAIGWAWELVVGRWKFPPNRVYATIYQPDKSKGDPADRDEESWNLWAEKFRAAGLDPDIHIVNGNKKDNFWMMADTGPCGPCTEVHIDLTPSGDTRGALVNKGTAECIEIWNNVFIQYNANPDGTFTPLPAQHVDTGMGLERVCAIIEGTKNFTEFSNARISNYETTVFLPIFQEISRMSGGKHYAGTLPQANDAGHLVPVTEQEKIDVAFRVIADHIRTLGFAIADGIQPGNTDRNYTLRRILRRAVKYGRTLGFTEPFFYKLVDVLAAHMGDVFPEIRVRKEQVKAVLKLEEEAFNRTLDNGLELFEVFLGKMDEAKSIADDIGSRLQLLEVFRQHSEKVLEADKVMVLKEIAERALSFFQGMDRVVAQKLASLRDYPLLTKASQLHQLIAVHEAGNLPASVMKEIRAAGKDILEWMDARLKATAELRELFPAEAAFVLYDTYGFPLDLTELLARERGLSVDTAGFDKLMEEQRDRARAAMKKNVVSVSEIETKETTKFLGYDALETDAKVLEVVAMKDKTAIVLDASACYAEMGGQVGDTGRIVVGPNTFEVLTTQKVGNTWLHFIEGDGVPAAGSDARLVVDATRRRAIERHHTVTHIMHWALHEVVNKDATQKGSYVGPEKLTFDFNSAALTAQQLGDIEKLVNERIVANDPVSWSEVPYVEAKANNGIMALFGEKYGDLVRVVQIGGQPHKLDGWSMELCGGTHTRGTGEIGLFRLVAESAVAAGVRRIEAIAGLEAYNAARADADLLKAVAGKVSAQGTHDLEKKIESLLEQQKTLEKNLKAAQQREAAGRAKELLATAANNAIITNLGDVDADYAVGVAEALKSAFNGVVVLAATGGGSVALIASVSKDHQAKVQAGKIIQTIAPIVGGKGGGKPDFARGGGKDVSKVDEALAEARKLVG